MQKLESRRYAVSQLGDEYDRNRIFVDLVGRNKRVLELGCSTGFLSRHLVERGCTVTGVEIDAAAAEEAAQVCERVESLDLNHAGWVSRVGGPFDAVLFGDVLEHLSDPGETLRQSAALLAPGGFAVISLPNIAHWSIRLGLLRGKFDYTETGILDVTHTKFFTLRTARRMIEAAGFRVDAFHPSIGGRMSGHLRPWWQSLALARPQVFAYQMLFRATPR